MMMHFHGGGVRHSSTRAVTDTFKGDQDDLDIKSQQAWKESSTHLNVDEDEGMCDDEMSAEFSDGENEIEEDAVDKEGQLSESELVDYGYEPESDSDEEEEEDNDREAGEEDDTTIDELGTLVYADY